MKALIPVLDQFLYFLDSKFTIKLLTTNSKAGRWKQSKNNNEKHQHPEKTMAIDQTFGERGGISLIRFISFPAALTFPFAHSNWQNKIPVQLSSLSSTWCNHSYTAPYTFTSLFLHPCIPLELGLIITEDETYTEHMPFAMESHKYTCHWASL